MPSTYPALLRGINLGGKNRLPVKDLVRLFAEAGCRDVRSYIQSGNVVFNADPAIAGSLPGSIAEAIAETFGYLVPVILRTAEEIEEAVSSNPFLAGGAPEDALHLLFLADRPEPGRIDSLDPDRSRPERFAVRGREVYLWLPNGVARTKLTNEYFDSRLATVSTGRNWRTVLKLLEMMKD